MTDHHRIRLSATLMLGLFCLFCPTVVLLVPRLCGTDTPILLLIAGVLLSLIAIPFHLLGGRKRAGRMRWRVLFYGIVLLLNTAGISFCEAAYYTHIEVTAPSTALTAGMVIPLGVAVLLWLVLTVFPTRYAGLTLGGSLLTGAGLIGSLVMWILRRGTPDAVFWSFLFFSLLGLLALIIALYAACEDDSQPSHPLVTALRYPSFASFGLLLLVAAIVLFILMCAGGDCDCDCGDGCDCPSGTNKKSQTKSINS